MEFPDGFPDRGELVLIALLEADGQLNTRELRKSIQALDRDQINYRVRRLSQLDLVETERQGEDDRGQPRPKLVTLTDDGHGLAADASEQLRYQIDVTGDTVTRTDDELASIKERLDTLADQVDMHHGELQEAKDVFEIVDERLEAVEEAVKRIDALEESVANLEDQFRALEGE